MFNPQLEGSSCPFPLLSVPPYVPVDMGKWKLRLRKGPPIIRGYFGGLQLCTPHNWTLTHEDTVWMSVTPMELESAAHHALEARGDVLIMGFGMGVLAWNVAQKASVKTVQIVEKDPAVISMASRLLHSPGWEKLRQKATLIAGDALLFKGSADVVLADIWPSLGDDKLRGDLRKMAANVQAQEFAAWGLELDFIEWCFKRKYKPDTLRGRQWLDYSDSIEVPLIMAGNLRKANTIVKAALSAAYNVVMA